MDNIRSAFERELKLKLSQKATPKIAEDVVLLRNFKYFDLNNNGRVVKNEFAKALTKIGVSSFEPEVRNTFFVYFHTNTIILRKYNNFSISMI